MSTDVQLQLLENLPPSFGPIRDEHVNVPDCTQEAHYSQTSPTFHQDYLLEEVRTIYGLFCGRSHRSYIKFMCDSIFEIFVLIFGSF